MIEYLNLFLNSVLCFSLLMLILRLKKYLTLLKMADETIENLLISYDEHTPPVLGQQKLDTKKQKLLECVLTGNSKLYLGKVYTEEQIKELKEEEVEKLFNNYEAKLSGQMVKSLGRSIINMYSMGACAALGISDKNALSEDLENDPFLNAALQRFTCELYYKFGSLLAPLSVGLITSKHYLCEYNINGERTSGNGERTRGNDREKELIVNG